MMMMMMMNNNYNNKNVPFFVLKVKSVYIIIYNIIISFSIYSSIYFIVRRRRHLAV